MGCVTSYFNKMNINTNRRRKTDDDSGFAVHKRAKVVDLNYDPAPARCGNFVVPSGSSKARTSTRTTPKVASSSKPKVTKVPTTDTSDESDFEETIVWNEVEVLSVAEKVSLTLASSFVKLLSEGCTLPFIARYRKANVGNLLPVRLQELYESYQAASALKKKVKTVLVTLKKNKKLTKDVEKAILSARSTAELDLVYAPLKTHTLSLAERARKLGLEEYAIKALNGEHVVPQSLCHTGKDELATADKIEAHLTHIIGDIITKDTRVLEQIRALKSETNFTILSSRSKSSLKTKEKVDATDKKIDSKSDPETYKIYFDWKCPAKYVKPHQMLALNRGEDEKILSIKVNVPDWFYHKLEKFCLHLWRSDFWVSKALNDAYGRQIKPWLSRQVRSELTTLAHKEAVKTFTSNLEKYLLTEPIKNRRICGLDPGFRAGCKVGIIDIDGKPLESCTIHPDFKRFNERDTAARQLKEMLRKHGVQLIGLGNGTACRETEQWLKAHNIMTNPIVIVPEQGASIYSISKEAQKEHANMDPNLISALSIARRVLDPLGELIKVDPKNLGVGLYQHDIPPKMLESALECVVENIVSLVGVDVNTASQALLRRVSGLNNSRAQKLIDYRSANGPLASRAEILQVSGIGKVTYQQCAGFLRVLGGSEPLDATVIHPESYKVAKLFAKKIGVNIKDLTNPLFPETVERKLAGVNLEAMSKELKIDRCDLDLIVNAFKQRSNEADEISFCKPVYSISAGSGDELRQGMTLTGVVRNVVPFGCFVDCGVGDNGLIHTSNLNGHQMPKLGDRVSVTVSAPPAPKKLQLRLERILD